MAEVDTSDVWVGSVLSYHSKMNHKFLCLHLAVCHLLEDIMTSTIGSCGRCRWHWRSGATGYRVPRNPFVLWTYHKNLENIHSAKKLNSCKAPFSHFNFILSYHPGSCSIKADVLFQQLQNWEDPVKCAASILHFSCVVVKLIWEAEECVKAAMGAHQWAPVVAPTDICLMSVWLRSEVQKWAHSSNLICPPGVQWTWCVLALEVRIVFWMYSGFM